MSDDVGVFISHADEDHSVAIRICAVLERAGIRVWIAPRDIAPGQDYVAAISAELGRSPVVVLVLSEAANTSVWVAREIGTALNENSTVIPVRVDKTIAGNRLRLVATLQSLEIDLDDPRMEHLVAAVRGAPRVAPKPPTLFKFALAGTAICVEAVLLGVWGAIALLGFTSRTGVCEFFGRSMSCSLGGGYVLMVAFLLLIAGVALRNRNRIAVPLMWLTTALLIPGAIDGFLHRYTDAAQRSSGVGLLAVALGVAVPLVIAGMATHRRDALS